MILDEYVEEILIGASWKCSLELFNTPEQHDAVANKLKEANVNGLRDRLLRANANVSNYNEEQAYIVGKRLLAELKDEVQGAN